MKNFATIILLCVMTMSLSGAFALTDKKDPSAKNNSVEFVKVDGDDLVFKTDLNNLPEGGCMLLIKDQDGNVLLSEKIFGNAHQKLYRIKREMMNGLNFEVRSKKFSFRESFDFKTKVQETFSVTKAGA